ncbi:group 1 glycosyl transferase, partial [Candidatus Magnetomorum sp. HK-1]
MQKNDIEYTFNNQRIAIKSLINLFKNRNEYLIIRHHPNIVGPTWKDVNFLKEMFKINRNIPENVRVIMPYEKITSYSIIKIANAVISSSGTTAFESILRGISSCSIRNNIYSAVNCGFNMIDSVSDCTKKIDQAIDQTNNFNILDLRKIFRAAYFIFFRLNYTFKAIGIDDKKRPYIQISSLNEQDINLNLICDHIMFNKPLYPIPDEKYLQRTDNEENEFLKKEFETILEKRQQKTIKVINLNYNEPLLSILQIKNNSYNNIN